MTSKSSPVIYQKLNYQGSQPAVFLIQNNAPAVTFDSFNDELVTKFLQAHPAKTEVTTEDPRDPLDARRKNQVLIDKFLASLDGARSSLKKDSVVPNLIIEDVKKGPDVYLTK